MIIAFFSCSLSLYPFSIRRLLYPSHRHQTSPEYLHHIPFSLFSFLRFHISTISRIANWRHDERSPKIDGRRLESRLESRIGSTEREKSEEYRATWQLSTKGRRNRWEWRSRGFHGTTRRTDTRSGSKHTRIANSCSAMFASEFPPPRGGSIVSQGGTTW